MSHWPPPGPRQAKAASAGGARSKAAAALAGVTAALAAAVLVTSAVTAPPCDAQSCGDLYAQCARGCPCQEPFYPWLHPPRPCVHGQLRGPADPLQRGGLRAKHGRDRPAVLPGAVMCLGACVRMPELSACLAAPA